MWPSNMRVSFVLAFALIGFTATIGQILVLRELLTVFSGSELSVAFVLGAWLLWTAAGSVAGGRMRAPGSPRLFACLQTASGPILIATILLIRAARPLLHVGAGELVSLGQMLAISFLTLAPFCLVSGFLFTLACSVLAFHIPGWKRSPGTVYFLEGLGAGSGGLLFSLVLVHHFNAVQIAGGIALCLWGSGVILGWPWSHRILSWAAFAGIFLFLAAILGQGEALNRLSRQWQWQGFHLLDSRETVYGHISVVSRNGQRSFFENGLWNFTVPDPLGAEEAVHYALLQHPGPRRVLLIGGGVSGTLEQLLQHPSIQQVDYVELDPALIRLAREYLPPEVTAALDDRRVAVHRQDGRVYLSRAASSYDVILVNVPEPLTAQLNRFYTREFFRLAAERLRNGGLLSFSASAAETAPGPIQARYLSVLRETAASVFPSVVVFPGSTARFFCAKAEGVLTRRPEVLVTRLRGRNLQLLYVREDYMLWDLSLLRQQSFMEMIGQAQEGDLNRDLNPKAYFYNLLLWGSQYSPALRHLFGSWSPRVIWTLTALLCFLAPGLSRVVRTRADPQAMFRTRVLYAVAIFGLTGISLEIIIVFAFQIFFGSLYYKIGLLLTLFMVGLALGSLLLTYYPKARPAQLKDLVLLQGGLGLFCLVLILVIFSFHGNPELVARGFFYEEVFSFMSLVAGFLGGTHFPLANRLLAEEQGRVGRAAGTIYAFDLAGSFAGSLVVGLIFVPIMGVGQSLVLVALLNLSAVFILL